MSIADELITRGHTRGGLFVDRDGVCLWGAAAYAYHGGRVRDAIADLRLSNALHIAINGEPDGWHHGEAWWRDFVTVMKFSDTHSFDEVLRVAKVADELYDGWQQ